MASKRYKDHRFYSFITLNLLFSTLDLYLFQKDLSNILDDNLSEQEGLPKSAVMHEIKSNHNMTNKVIEELETKELVFIHKERREYRIKITKKGVMYLREYSRFYQDIFTKEIADLYKFRRIPAWAEIP